MKLFQEHREACPPSYGDDLGSATPRPAIIERVCHRSYRLCRHGQRDERAIETMQREKDSAAPNCQQQETLEVPRQEVREVDGEELSKQVCHSDGAEANPDGPRKQPSLYAQTRAE